MPLTLLCRGTLDVLGKPTSRLQLQWLRSSPMSTKTKQTPTGALALRALLDGSNIPGTYNNDTEAAAGGVPVGGIYKNSNGTIHWPRELILTSLVCN